MVNNNSLVLSNFSFIYDKIICDKMKIFSVYLSVLFFISITLNSSYIWVFSTNKKLWTPIYSFLMSLTILSLIATFLEYPILIYNGFSCEYVLLLNFLKQTLFSNLF